MRKFITGAAVAGTAAIIAAAAITPIALANDVHHPDCDGLVKDIPPGVGTPIAGDVYVKAGNDHVYVGYQWAGYVAGPQNGHAVSHVDVCPDYDMPTTTTEVTRSTTTTIPETTSTESSTTSTSTTTTPTTSTTEPGTTSSTTTSPGTTSSSTTNPGRNTTTSAPSIGGGR